jgi:hypothetical protein
LAADDFQRFGRLDAYKVLLVLTDGYHNTYYNPNFNRGETAGNGM